MDIIKKLFSFGNDDAIIGLCKFNDEFFKAENLKQTAKKRLSKEANLTQMLKRSY